MKKENIMTSAKTKQNVQKSIGRPASKTATRKSGTSKQTKKARLIALLSRKSGANVPSLSTALEWLPHTTRAALSGLRKAGYEIKSVKPGKGKPSRYWIIGVPSGEAA
jgi:predicted ArsR family transcriptional regulator